MGGLFILHLDIELKLVFIYLNMSIVIILMEDICL